MIFVIELKIHDLYSSSLCCLKLSVGNNMFWDLFDKQFNICRTNIVNFLLLLKEWLIYSHQKQIILKKCMGKRVTSKLNRLLKKWTLWWELTIDQTNQNYIYENVRSPCSQTDKQWRKCFITNDDWLTGRLFLT